MFSSLCFIENWCCANFDRWQCNIYVQISVSFNVLICHINADLYYVKVLGYQYNETNVRHVLFNLLRIKGLLYVSSITCSSSGGDTQTALGILRACNVSLLLSGLEWNAVPLQALTLFLYRINVTFGERYPTNAHKQFLLCLLPYFPGYSAHLTYNAHPKLFCVPFEVQITRT
jgi:hypothetical protein